MKINLLILLLIPFLMGAAGRSLDGADDRLTQGNIFDVTTGSISLGGWVKLTEDASIDVIAGKKATTGTGYHLVQSTADVTSFTVVGGSGSVTSSATTDIDGVWYFVAGTWDGSNDITRIYINGTQEDSDDVADRGSVTTAAYFRMGADGVATADYYGTGIWGYQVVWNAAIISPVFINEFMWKPEISGAIPDMLITPWGDSPEIDLSYNDDPAGVTGATTSTDGPPAMWGGGLPL